MPAGLPKRLVMLALIALNVACDQWSKDYVRQHVQPESYTELAGPAFILTRVENTGAFLGLGQDWGPWTKRILLNGIPVALLLFLSYRMLFRSDWKGLMLAGLCCIIGGGLGNLWDRLLLGSVTDFFQLRAGPLHTGIFNMADVSVSLGLGLVVLAYLRNRKPTEA